MHCVHQTQLDQLTEHQEKAECRSEPRRTTDFLKHNPPECEGGNTGISHYGERVVLIRRSHDYIPPSPWAGHSLYMFPYVGCTGALKEALRLEGFSDDTTLIFGPFN